MLRRLGPLVRLAIPIVFVQLSLQTVGFVDAVLAGLLAGRMGAREMASHQVAIALASFAFMVPLGIGAATSVQVGRAVGRGDVEDTHHSGLLGLGLGGGFMLGTALVMWFFPSALARILSSDPEVVAAASLVIRVAAAFQIFDGIQAVASGALRGTGSTRWAMAANLVAYWLVALPVAYVLGFGKRLGVTGLWWGLTAGLAVAAVTLTAKFVRISRRPIAALA